MAVLAALAPVRATGSRGDERPAASCAGVPDRLQVSTDGWKTDFADRSMPISEFVSGGPGKDGGRGAHRTAGPDAERR